MIQTRELGLARAGGRIVRSVVGVVRCWRFRLCEMASLILIPWTFGLGERVVTLRMWAVAESTRLVRCQVPRKVWNAGRRHREFSARSEEGPWRRLLVRVDEAGVEVVCDRDEEPFPSEQLFTPDAYRADLESYPRSQLPVWLAAYIRPENSLSRPPRRAAVDARADRAAGVRGCRSLVSCWS